MLFKAKLAIKWSGNYFFILEKYLKCKWLTNNKIIKLLQCLEIIVNYVFYDL